MLKVITRYSRKSLTTCLGSKWVIRLPKLFLAWKYIFHIKFSLDFLFNTHSIYIIKPYARFISKLSFPPKHSQIALLHILWRDYQRNHTMEHCTSDTGLNKTSEIIWGVTPSETSARIVRRKAPLVLLATLASLLSLPLSQRYYYRSSTVFLLFVFFFL